MIKKLLVLLLFPAILFSGGCRDKGPDDLDKDPFDKYDRKEMLRNLGENVIIPAFEDLSQKTNALKQAVADFNNSPTENTLVAAQNAWKEAGYAWRRAELYKLGPLDEGGNGLLATIDHGSANTMYIENAVNPAGLENVISSAPGTIDNNYIESVGTTMKGFPTIEYLLFNPEQGNSVVITQYTTGNNAQKRKQYLAAAAENLHNKAEFILNGWKPNGGNHLQVFINSDGRDIGSSIGMMVNEIVYQVEAVRNEKVGRPLGKRTNGNLQPQSVEAKYSKSSVAFIKENINGIEKAFTGHGTAGDKQGFDDLLDHLGAKSEATGESLSTMIKNQLALVRQRADAVNMPLQDAVSQNTQAVDDLYRELNRLLVLTKVDMVNNIGVVITYIDNDGD